MNIKSPISVDIIQFYTYNCDETDDSAFIERFPYDDRHDFLVDGNFAGIAVRIEVCNNRPDKGARRNISLTLVDMTLRCTVATQTVKVNLAADGYKDVCLNFPAEPSGIAGDHTYKLAVRDQTAGLPLAESVIHLLDKSTMGDPTEWYRICDGGIRPSWGNDVYRSLNTIDTHEYLVRFVVSPEICCLLLPVMPELEVRLYYPDGENVKVFFREPFCCNPESYKDNRWTIECPFGTAGDINGVFYAELLCMEYPVAGFVFDSLSDEDIRGVWFGHEIEPMDEYSLPDAKALIDRRFNRDIGADSIPEADSLDDAIDRFLASQSEGPDDDDASLADGRAETEDSLEEASEVKCAPFMSLDHLTGLRAVKEKLSVYERVVRFNRMRSDKGLSVAAAPLHSMFLGSPGTGKTTVAKLIGKMLHQAGVLSEGHVVVRERASLLGQNYNSESEKTLEAIEKAQGGILFIDEAYQLCQPNDPRDPGRFVIETLLTALSDDTNRDWMLILAGYPDEMKRMSDMNPGFKSRIPEANIYTFDDFTEAELMEIAENYLVRNNYTLTSGARKALIARLKADYERRVKNFGNARHVMNMIQTEILPAMAVRVVGEGMTDDKSLTEIQEADIPAAAPMTAPTPLSRRVGFAV
ncbi:MAG: AAA family ATPase [Muribaculaceae bacterium]|nr:AAA family ATPase [Muribaculaceae bacterium]